MHTPETRRVKFGDFCLEPSGGILRKGTEQVKIQPQPFTVLLALAEKRGGVVTRDELRELLWGNATYVDFEQGLNFCIRQIRIALNDNAREPSYIETLPKQGYRLIAPVSMKEDEPAPINPAPINNVGPAGVKRRIPVWSVVLATAAVLFLLIGIRFRVPGRRWEEIPSFIVLPLANKTNDATLDYLADGVTSDIIRRLAMIPGLRVISRTSVLQINPKDRNSHSLAERFGVNRIITGSIRGTTQDLAIDIEVSDARDGSLTLTRSYAPGETNFGALTSTISGDIANAVKLKLTDRDERKLRKPITSSREALSLFMQAESLLDSLNPPQIVKAAEVSAKAVEKDPNFALALTQEAGARLLLGLYFEDPRNHLPEAKQLALRALSLDDTLVEPHGILGIIALTYDWDFREADRQLILATGRMNHTALEQLGCVTHLMASTGRAVKGEDEVRAALVDNPLGVALLQELGCNAYYARHYERALIGYRRALEVDPGGITALWGMGKTYAQMGRYPEALEALKPATVHGNTPPVILSEVGYVYARMGNTRAAKDTLHRLRKMSESMFVDPYFESVVSLGLGDHEATFLALEEAYQVRSTILVSIHSDPKWDGLHHDARFRELEKKMGLEPGG